ncbi:Repeat domain-containing protein [Oscillibacter sp. PC13]|uniref:FG-GAP repeat domain-containing protein n=1 Tax=Oscillibacter sp. PC13 TaxID=1855299 RepID=UPI0008EF2B7F|nr:VCBS repeat-containing protein [Oscillibacter sp. PC13]SFP19840.1 Repeat domain-containing protein [Oscillibacter sp. PC13]
MAVKKVLRAVSCLLILAVLLPGTCSCGVGFVFNPQELYSLPKLPTEYTELDNCIKAVLQSGAEYAAPTAGTHVQAVQLVDLNGDGLEEAIAFFRNSEDERPLKIYIFSSKGQSYEQTAVIEGSGTSIYSIAYEDLDQDGHTELVVGWRAGTDLQALSVYSLRQKEPVELLRTNYVRYAVTDLDQDQLRELVVFRADDEGNGVADYYEWQDSGLSPRTSARISMTMAELSQQGQMKKGTLQGEIPALFVTGVEDSTNAITDILTVRNGELANIVLSDVTGVSTEIAPFRSLYPTDINNDGLTEVPWPVNLPAWDNGETAPYQQIDWRSYDAKGTAATVLSTYHNLEDGWYFQLPENWCGKIMVTRTVMPEEAAVTFSMLNADQGGPQAFLRISALTGSSRDIRAVRGNRFTLSRQAETTFTAELLDDSGTWSDALTEDEVREAFSLITKEWDDN